jgi:hypothetical protein
VSTLHLSTIARARLRLPPGLSIDPVRCEDGITVFCYCYDAAGELRQVIAFDDIPRGSEQQLAFKHGVETR